MKARRRNLVLVEQGSIDGERWWQQLGSSWGSSGCREHPVRHKEPGFGRCLFRDIFLQIFHHKLKRQWSDFDDSWWEAATCLDHTLCGLGFWGTSLSALSGLPLLLFEEKYHSQPVSHLLRWQVTSFGEFPCGCEAAWCPLIQKEVHAVADYQNTSVQWDNVTFRNSFQCA